MVQTTKEERFSKYVEKVQSANDQNQRKVLPSCTAMSDFYAQYASIIGILELKGVSRAHVIGLSACMENLCNPASNLSLFSGSLDLAVEKLADGILSVACKKKPTPAASKLVKWWLILSLMTVVGLLELGKAKERVYKEEEIPPDVDFQNELLLLLFFASDYPKIVFKEMGEAVNVPRERISTFTALFELLALVFALIASSKEEEGLKTELVEDLAPKLLQDLDLVLSSLEETDQAGSSRPFLEQIRTSLEKGERDNLILICQDLLESGGYSRETLFKDVSAMKELFIRLKQACLDSKARPTNVVHMVG
jgi:hypothetical protein